MKKIISIILLLLTCHTWIMAQINNIIPSAPSIANTPTARTDQWSAFANPASLTENKRFSFAFTYENKYLLAELSGKTAQAAYCNPWVNVGIAFTHFGYKQYSDIMAGICLSHDFSGKFSIGLQGNYYAAYFGPETGYVYTIFLDAGHGGSDPGAVYNGRQDMDDPLALALAVGEILKSYGFNVIYSRTEDIYESPYQKAAKGNASGADIFISIHRNSSPYQHQPTAGGNRL